MMHNISLFLALMFHESAYGETLQSYFNEVDKTASGSSYNTLRLWEIHSYLFIDVFRIH